MFNPLTLNDKETYLKYYNYEKYPHSQYNFTTLYIWRRYLNTSFKIENGCFCIRHTTKDKTFYMFPVGEKNQCETVFKLLFETDGNVSLSCITKDMYDSLTFKKQVNLCDARYNHDYVYETQKLITLSGKKLHSKRNHVNKFLNTYSNFRFEPITKNNLKDCFSITDIWFKRKYKNINDYAQEEYNSIKDVLNNMEYLSCRGMVLYVNDKPAAYSVGEYMNNTTALIHIEKATGEFDGSYPMINNLMCKHIFPDTQFINREEDMDIENLRKAKLSYHPHHMVEVFNITKV